MHSASWSISTNNLTPISIILFWSYNCQEVKSIELKILIRSNDNNDFNIYIRLDIYLYNVDNLFLEMANINLNSYKYDTLKLNQQIISSQHIAICSNRKFKWDKTTIRQTFNVKKLFQLVISSINNLFLKYLLWTIVKWKFILQLINDWNFYHNLGHQVLGKAKGISRWSLYLGQPLNMLVPLVTLKKSTDNIRILISHKI